MVKESYIYVFMDADGFICMHICIHGADAQKKRCAKLNPRENSLNSKNLSKKFENKKNIFFYSMKNICKGGPL